MTAPTRPARRADPARWRSPCLTTASCWSKTTTKYLVAPIFRATASPAASLSIQGRHREQRRHFSGPTQHQLHAARLAVRGHGGIHRGEGRFVHLHGVIAVLLARLRLVADGADWRMAEDHGRDIAVVEPSGLLLNRRSDRTIGPGHGDRRRLDGVSIIAHRVDARYVAFWNLSTMM